MNVRENLTRVILLALAFCLLAGGPVQAQLDVTPSSLTFSAEAGGANPASQTLLVEDPADGNVSWTGTVPTTDGGKWLALSPSSGTTPGKPSVLVDITGLMAGSYRGEVSISEPEEKATVVAVTVEVTAVLNVSPSSLAFSAEAGGANPASQTLLVEDPNDGNVGWTATVSTTDGGRWLSIFPSSGTTPSKISVSVDIEGSGGRELHRRGVNQPSRRRACCSCSHGASFCADRGARSPEVFRHGWSSR